MCSADELPSAIRQQVTFAAVWRPCIAGELGWAASNLRLFYFARRRGSSGSAPVIQTSYYHISLTTDIIGVEVCVALKNAYTLAVGLAEGMLEQVGGVDERGLGITIQRRRSLGGPPRRWPGWFRYWRPTRRWSNPCQGWEINTSPAWAGVRCAWDGSWAEG